MTLADRDEIVRRAENLLLSWLTEEQATQYRESAHHHGGPFFYVTGCDTGLQYRITSLNVYNVQQMSRDGKDIVKQICFIPEKFLPKPDVMLAQKLGLELAENVVLTIAKQHSDEPLY